MPVTSSYDTLTSTDTATRNRPVMLTEVSLRFSKTGNTFCKIITRTYEKLRDVDRSVGAFN